MSFHSEETLVLIRSSLMPLPIRIHTLIHTLIQAQDQDWDQRQSQSDTSQLLALPASGLCPVTDRPRAGESQGRTNSSNSGFQLTPLNCRIVEFPIVHPFIPSILFIPSSPEPLREWKIVSPNACGYSAQAHTFNSLRAHLISSELLRFRSGMVTVETLSIRMVISRVQTLVLASLQVFTYGILSKRLPAG
jgi:hypothetical protein